MDKRFVFYILLVVLLPLQSIAQVNPFLKRDAAPAYHNGEVLKYSVNYSGALITTGVADVEMSVYNDSIAGKNCLKIIGAGRTRPFFDIFFPLSDVYISWIDATTLKPYKATSNQKEGGYEYESDFRFNWDKKIAFTTGHNIKRDRYYRQELSLEEYSYDALSLFYNLRMMDFSQAQKPGDSFRASLVLEDTVRTLHLKFIGKEQIKVKKLGYFNAYKFSCNFATSTDDSFKDGTEFFIWMSDDKNKIPLYLESPIKVGKIFVSLTDYSGLANPATSAQSR